MTFKEMQKWSDINLTIFEAICDKRTDYDFVRLPDEVIHLINKSVSYRFLSELDTRLN